jgi:hypothetical protein
MRQCRREARINESSSSKVHRREGYLATVQMKPVIFSLFRCTSTKFFFFCCDSVAALRASA